MAVAAGGAVAVDGMVALGGTVEVGAVVAVTAGVAVLVGSPVAMAVRVGVRCMAVDDGDATALRVGVRTAVAVGVCAATLVFVGTGGLVIVGAGGLVAVGSACCVGVAVLINTTWTAVSLPQPVPRRSAAEVARPPSSEAWIRVFTMRTLRCLRAGDRARAAVDRSGAARAAHDRAAEVGRRDQVAICARVEVDGEQLTAGNRAAGLRDAHDADRV